MGLYYEDFSVGDAVETPARTVTETDVVNFAGLSGDYNPLHTDAAFAAADKAIAKTEASFTKQIDEQRKSIDALTTDLTKQGWQVRKAKLDGGCYEVYGTTPQGDRVEAYFDPVSYEKLLVSRRGQVLYKKP